MGMEKLNPVRPKEIEEFRQKGYEVLYIDTASLSSPKELETEILGLRLRLNDKSKLAVFIRGEGGYSNLTQDGFLKFADGILTETNIRDWWKNLPDCETVVVMEQSDARYFTDTFAKGRTHTSVVVMESPFSPDLKTNYGVKVFSEITFGKTPDKALRDVLNSQAPKEYRESVSTMIVGGAPAESEEEPVRDWRVISPVDTDERRVDALAAKLEGLLPMPKGINPVWWAKSWKGVVDSYLNLIATLRSFESPFPKAGEPACLPAGVKYLINCYKVYQDTMTKWSPVIMSVGNAEIIRDVKAHLSRIGGILVTDILAKMKEYIPQWTENYLSEKNADFIVVREVFEKMFKEIEDKKFDYVFTKAQEEILDNIHEIVHLSKLCWLENGEYKFSKNYNVADVAYHARTDLTVAWDAKEQAWADFKFSSSKGAVKTIATRIGRLVLNITQAKEDIANAEKQWKGRKAKSALGHLENAEARLNDESFDKDPVIKREKDKLLEQITAKKALYVQFIDLVQSKNYREAHAILYENGMVRYGWDEIKEKIQRMGVSFVRDTYSNGSENVQLDIDLGELELDIDNSRNYRGDTGEIFYVLRKSRCQCPVEGWNRKTLDRDDFISIEQMEKAVETGNLNLGNKNFGNCRKEVVVSIDHVSAARMMNTGPGLDTSWPHESNPTQLNFSLNWLGHYGNGEQKDNEGYFAMLQYIPPHRKILLGGGGEFQSHYWRVQGGIGATYEEFDVTYDDGYPEKLWRAGFDYIGMVNLYPFADTELANRVHLTAGGSFMVLISGASFVGNPFSGYQYMGYVPLDVSLFGGFGVDLN